MKHAPDFALKDQEGTLHTLAEYRGTWLVLYFYPKDATPGCTTELCNFRDARLDLEPLAKVVGISTDSVASHKRFAEKHDASFTLLSDPDHRVLAAYDAWKPKRIMGKDFLGTQRDTFIIDPRGNIAKEYRGVDPTVHAAEVVRDLQAFLAADTDA